MHTIARRSSAVMIMVLANGVLGACSSSESGENDSARRTAAAADTSTGAGSSEARCYRSDVSVLLGPSRAGTSEGTPPGWIRLEGLGADSGMARVMDANGAGLMAQWRRVEGDSIHLAGFDDFLRVEMRLAATDARVSGRAVATSDAAAERDSAGRSQDLRREWSVTAAPAPCDSMPAGANDAAR